MNAFPNQGHTLESLKEMNGMDLRDYFAARALQLYVGNGNTNKEDIARVCYEIAEAMLMEREK